MRPDTCLSPPLMCFQCPAQCLTKTSYSVDIFFIGGCVADAVLGLLGLSFRTKAFIPPAAGTSAAKGSQSHLSRNFPQGKIHSSLQGLRPMGGL